MDARQALQWRQIDMIIVPDDPGLASSGETLDAVAVKIFDGDGFLANVRHPLRGTVVRAPFRFAFIDAPELDQECGLQSRDFLGNLILGKRLQLAPIFKESSQSPVDQYKRMLCMAFLTEPMNVGPIEYYRDGGSNLGTVKRARSAIRNIELEMIVNGWAWVLERYAFDREDEYHGAQEDARRNRRGFWALSHPEPPWNFKRRTRRRSLKYAEQGQLL